MDLTLSATLYDAVMLYTHAGTKVLAEGGDLHDGHVMAEAVRSTTFEGLGNRAVVPNSQGDRIQSYEVMSYVQGADAAMGTVPAGVYINEEHQYRAVQGQETPPLCPLTLLQVNPDYLTNTLTGGSSRAPGDRVVVQETVGAMANGLADQPAQQDSRPAGPAAGPAS